jgi:hypothetical protein
MKSFQACWRACSGLLTKANRYLANQSSCRSCSPFTDSPDNNCSAELQSFSVL